MHQIAWINHALTLLFLACYGHQLFYLLYALLRPRRTAPLPASVPLPGNRRYAVLICARNEESVIATPLQSIRAQTYPAELLEAFVLADNCTDDTARIAAEQGAAVYQRRDPQRVGKGYALQYLLKRIWEERGEDAFDGYFILDADNRLETDFVVRMDETFAAGHRIVTAYRAAGNYADSWISAGNGLWFLRESRFLNGSRMELGVSCTVTGTGFLVHKDILLQQGGWQHFLLTEDAEFSAAQILAGERIAYCPRAVFYDEQPVTFSQSWRQRLRWCKGYMQVLRRYGGKLLLGALSGRFSCFDNIMSILPALAISLLAALLNLLGAGLAAMAGGSGLDILLRALLQGLICMYGTFFLIGLAVTLGEWRRISCSAAKKIFYVFTFPLFTFTYLPISAAALFQRVEWKPIHHGGTPQTKHGKRLHFARFRGKIKASR